MFPNVYCPLCGVIMLDIRYLDDSAREAQRRPWYSEVRGLYQTDAPRSIYLTRLGFIRRRKILCAPPESHRSYFDWGIDSLEEWTVCGFPEKEPWCFSFHDSCWKLFLLRLSNKQKKALRHEVIIESLFCQLYCTPCFEHSVFQFGHDYEGAAETHEPGRQANPVDLGSALYADPCIIEFAKDPEIIVGNGSNGKADIGFDDKDTFSSVSSSSKGVPTLSRFLQNAADRIRPMETHSSCIFDGLSPELRSEIFSYLSFSEVLSLRLVCRALALFATTSTLSQSYWRSRFFLGQEADFLFPSPTKSQNWMQLFNWTSLSLKRGVLSLVNRKRIRNLLEPFAALSELSGVFPRCEPYGSAFCPANNSDSFPPSFEKTSLPLQVGSSFSGLLPSGSTDISSYTGCRMTLFGPAESWAADFSIGYHIPGSVKWIEMPDNSCLREIHVAFCSEGLAGIRFVFADSTSSNWIGDTEGPGMAFGTLTVHEGPDPQYLLAGLDYFKIVSLGLSKVNEAPSYDLIDSPSSQSLLWAPCAPNKKSVEISTLLPLSNASRTFEPLMNIDFDGPEDLVVGRVRRITCYMTTGHCPLVGIEIFHSDGRSVLCGMRNGCELSFFLDGANGECIDKVDIYEDNSSNEHLGIFDDTEPDPITLLDGLQVR
ncbi:hypothetical protein N7528_004647 [Penicillium herquei]|nr:hypothetical protein N7528_004647 [Penicillium herquei]